MLSASACFAITHGRGFLSLGESTGSQRGHVGLSAADAAYGCCWSNRVPCKIFRKARCFIPLFFAGKVKPLVVWKIETLLNQRDSGSKSTAKVS